jgi:hypothetical protein
MIAGRTLFGPRSEATMVSVLLLSWEGLKASQPFLRGTVAKSLRAEHAVVTGVQTLPCHSD